MCMLADGSGIYIGMEMMADIELAEWREAYFIWNINNYLCLSNILDLRIYHVFFYYPGISGQNWSLISGLESNRWEMVP